MYFSGSLVPLITPFTKCGQIDITALKKLVRWHVSEGTDGIICCATTGEGVTLDSTERKRVTEVCLECAEGQLPIIVSTGTNDTRQSIQLTEMASRLGAKGCLAVTPYYNKPSQEGCIQHFEEIAKVGLPVILYHNPPRTGIHLTAETIFHLSKNTNIIGIKESSQDLDLVGEIAPHIPVFCGDDDLCVKMMKRGAIGSISTTSNVVPKAWKQMITDCQKANWENAEALLKRQEPLIRSLFLETNPQGVKYALSFMGYCNETLRLPLIPPTPFTKNKIKISLLSMALPHLKISSPIKKS